MDWSSGIKIRRYWILANFGFDTHAQIKILIFNNKIFLIIIKDNRSLWFRLLCRTQWTIIPDLARVSTKQILSNWLRSAVNSEACFHTRQITNNLGKHAPTGGELRQHWSGSAFCMFEWEKKIKTASKLLALVSYNWAPIDSEFRQNTIFDRRRISMISILWFSIHQHFILRALFFFF